MKDIFCSVILLGVYLFFGLSLIQHPNLYRGTTMVMDTSELSKMARSISYSDPRLNGAEDYSTYTGMLPMWFWDKNGINGTDLYSLMQANNDDANFYIDGNGDYFSALAKGWALDHPDTPFTDEDYDNLMGMAKNMEKVRKKWYNPTRWGGEGTADADDSFLASPATGQLLSLANSALQYAGTKYAPALDKYFQTYLGTSLTDLAKANRGLQEQDLFSNKGALFNGADSFFASNNNRTVIRNITKVKGGLQQLMDTIGKQVEAERIANTYADNPEFLKKYENAKTPTERHKLEQEELATRAQKKHDDELKTWVEKRDAEEAAWRERQRKINRAQENIKITPHINVGSRRRG